LQVVLGMMVYYTFILDTIYYCHRQVQYCEGFYVYGNCTWLELHCGWNF